jgi:NADH-quinone oxidoreductase subunit C
MSAKDQLIKELKALQATVAEVDYKRRGYHVEVFIDNDKVRDFAQVMRRKDYYLVFVGGVHTAEALEVTYLFASFTVPCRVLGRAPVDGDGTIPTICDIFDGANWHERETKDMYGIVFTGHPYLQPLLLAEEDVDMKPLLKAAGAVKSAEKLRWLPPAAPGEATAKPVPPTATKAAAATADAKPAKPAVPVQPGPAAETKDTQE